MLGLLDLSFEKHGLMLNCYIYTYGDTSKNIKDMGNVDKGIILFAEYEVRGTKILVPFFKYKVSGGKTLLKYKMMISVLLNASTLGQREIEYALPDNGGFWRFPGLYMSKRGTNASLQKAFWNEQIASHIRTPEL